MPRTKLAVVATVALLAGCAGMNYALEHYRNVPVQHFTASSGSSFRVYDKPAENRLMIAASIGSAMGGGLARGATFGAAGGSSAVVFRDASEEYLRSTGRDCRAADIALVVEPQYEVRYDCSATDL